MGKAILVILLVIAVGAGAAYGGYRMGDAAGFERANQVRQQFAQTRQTGQGQFTQGGQGAQGQFSQGGAMAGGGNRAFALQGTVKSVEGDTVTVTMGQRDVKVTLSDKTLILKSVSGTRAELAAGAQVTITPDGGTGGASDAVTASAITILPRQ